MNQSSAADTAAHPHEMRGSMAILLKDRMEGGRYAMPHQFKEDYREGIRGAPNLSSFNINTPKMWPIATTNFSKHQTSSPSETTSSLYVSTRSAGSSYPRGQDTIHSTFRGFEFSPTKSCSKSYDSADGDDSSFHSAGASAFAKLEKKGFLSSSLSRTEAPLLKDQPLSALQQTLLSCGKLQRADRVANEPIRAKVDQAINRGLDMMTEHAMWLQERERKRCGNNRDVKKQTPAGKSKASDKAMNEESIFGGDSSLADISAETVSKFSDHRTGVSKAKSSLTKSRKRTKVLYSGLYNNELPPEGVKEARSIKGYADMNELEDRLDELHACMASGDFDKRSRISYKSTCDVDGLLKEISRPSYSGLVLHNIGASAPDNLGNPYRQLNAGKHMQLRGAPTLDSLTVRDRKAVGGTMMQHNTNKRLYGKSQRVCAVGSYLVAIREPRRVRGILGGDSSITVQPSLKDVTESTALLSRKQLLAYDTRIVETGALLKALQDLRHKSPGLTAIISFHKSMVASAIINPNPYFISRSQMRDIIYSNVPWMDKDAIGRLISSYDPFQTGFVRYIRLSSAIIAGNRPSMSGLIASLNNGSKADDPNGVALVLALIFGLYQDCEGQQTPGNHGKFTTGGESTEDAKGMKLADIREALSCCVCSAADEVIITECADRIVQALFQQMQRKSLLAKSLFDDNDSASQLQPRASVMLGHGALSSMAQIEIVSQDDFTRAILEDRTVYAEFSRQLLKFREIVSHFAHVGSIPFATAKSKKSTYGTHKFS